MKYFIIIFLVLLLVYVCISFVNFILTKIVKRKKKNADISSVSQNTEISDSDTGAEDDINKS